MNPLQQCLRRNDPHLSQWLANCGKPRILKCRALNIIEADHGDIFGHPPPGFPQRTDRSNRRDIIERYQRRKRLVARKYLPGDFVA